MDINKGSTARPSGATATTASSTTLSLDTGDRCHFGLRAEHCANTSSKLPEALCKKLLDEWLRAIKTMPPRLLFYGLHARERAASSTQPSTLQTQPPQFKPRNQPSATKNWVPGAHGVVPTKHELVPQTGRYRYQPPSLSGKW